MQVSLDTFYPKNNVLDYEVRNLYRNIYKSGKSYIINHSGTNYGIFHKIESALIERDALESLGWNQELLFEIGEVNENQYLKKDLPPFPEKRSNGLICNNENDQYIYRTHNNRYIIQKCIEGKTTSFGVYKDLMDAKKIRNYLMKYGWSKNNLINARKNMKIYTAELMRNIIFKDGYYVLRRKYGDKVRVYYKSRNLLKVMRIRDQLKDNHWNNICFI